MCKFCPDETSHSPASTSSKSQNNPGRMIGQGSSDDGVTEEIEQELAVETKRAEKCGIVKAEAGLTDDGVEGLGTASMQVSKRTHRRSTKRPRGYDPEGACAARSRKRFRSEEPFGPAEQEAYEEKARVVGLVSNIFTLVVSLERTTQDVVGRSDALLALRDENVKLQSISQEKTKQNDELTRVLWTVRDQYYKLKAASVKAQAKSEQLNENLRMLTRDHDTLMRERNRAQATADSNAKKSDELQRVLWTVRGEYYKLKSNLEKSAADSNITSQRNNVLSQQAKDLACRNEELLEELKKVKEQNEALQSQSNSHDALTKELAAARAECERLRQSEQAAVSEIDRQKQLCDTAQREHETTALRVAETNETVEQLRHETQEGHDRELRLTAERDRLTHDKARLVKEMEKVTEERDRYRESHAQTIAEKGRLERAVAKTEEERLKLAEEKEKFVLDWDRLIMQRDKTLAERDFLRVECDAMHLQKLAITAEKARAEDALNKLLEEKEALVAERDALLDTKAQLSQDKTMLRIEVGRLLDQEAKQRIEDTLARAKNAELYDGLLKENVELRTRMAKMDKSAAKSKTR